YDAANRLLSRTLDPEGLALTTTYRYDAFGGQIAATSPGGVVTLTRHDANGRVLSQTVDPVSSEHPDGLNLVTRYAWDQRGAMLTMTS
ncbi:RHS repeat domain-containing protein, partial [Escherichia coli]|uniref:RHS repeat domain-containing protein n=1 Tax=Escherichia coli TaxID=562 RepID=UPI000CC2440E